jgi:hypothetical protein
LGESKLCGVDLQTGKALWPHLGLQPGEFQVNQLSSWDAYRMYTEGAINKKITEQWGQGYS